MHPLPKSNYHKITAQLNQIPFNNLFARTVAEQKLTGKIFVDDTENPKTFYVVHPYGMTLLLGESNNENFNSSFREYALNLNNERKTHEWMQVFPDNWNIVLEKLFKDKLIKSSDNTEKKETGIIELNARVNFKFNHEKYLSLRKTNLPSEIKTERTDRKNFREMKGSVVPVYFWESEDDFLKNGVGFSLFYNGILASATYSAFIKDDKLELGIETVEEFRGKGLAEYVCCAIIDYCLKNNYEPVWACRKENIGSYKLAQKLGFIPSLELPYYRLSK